MSHYPLQEKLKELETKLAVVRLKKKEILRTDCSSSKIKSPKTDFDKFPKKVLHHPKLEYIMGEVAHSPYLTKPLDPYTPSTINMVYELRAMKKEGIKLKDLPKEEQPFDPVKIKQQFMKEVIQFLPHFAQKISSASTTLRSISPKKISPEPLCYKEHTSCLLTQGSIDSDGIIFQNEDQEDLSKECYKPGILELVDTKHYFHNKNNNNNNKPKSNEKNKHLSNNHSTNNKIDKKNDVQSDKKKKSKDQLKNLSVNIESEYSEVPNHFLSKIIEGSNEFATGELCPPSCQPMPSSSPQKDNVCSLPQIGKNKKLTSKSNDVQTPESRNGTGRGKRQSLSKSSISSDRKVVSASKHRPSTKGLKISSSVLSAKDKDQPASCVEPELPSTHLVRPKTCNRPKMEIIQSDPVLAPVPSSACRSASLPAMPSPRTDGSAGIQPAPMQGQAAAVASPEPPPQQSYLISRPQSAAPPIDTSPAGEQQENCSVVVDDEEKGYDGYGDDFDAPNSVAKQQAMGSDAKGVADSDGVTAEEDDDDGATYDSEAYETASYCSSQPTPLRRDHSMNNTFTIAAIEEDTKSDQLLTAGEMMTESQSGVVAVVEAQEEKEKEGEGEGEEEDEGYDEDEFSSSPIRSSPTQRPAALLASDPSLNEPEGEAEAEAFCPQQANDVDNNSRCNPYDEDDDDYSDF